MTSCVGYYVVIFSRIDSCGLITYFSLVNKILILSLTRFADSQHAALLSNVSFF